MLKTIADIKAASEADNSASLFWFSEATMEFFNTRVLTEVFDMGDNGSLFITAERENLADAERYAIRWARVRDGIFSIVTLGSLRAYGSTSAALVAADHISNVIPDILLWA